MQFLATLPERHFRAIVLGLLTMLCLFAWDTRAKLAAIERDQSWLHGDVHAPEKKP